MRAVAVDGVVILDERILLVRRGRDPHRGAWALPGGFLENDENAEEGVVREIKEETGVNVKVVGMVGVYSEPDRDPRGTVSIAFLCQALSRRTKGGGDAKEARWFPIEKIWKLKLAFDHRIIVEDALRKRGWCR